MCWSISQLINLVHGCAVFGVDINSITKLVWAGRLRASGALGLGACALTRLTRRIHSCFAIAGGSRQGARPPGERVRVRQQDVLSMKQFYYRGMNYQGFR